jgi:pimeloyl-ACP methyl ester carboxylesterase
VVVFVFTDKLMDKTSLWTHSGARLQRVRSEEGKDLHWIFLPGGPGLGSESLILLCNILELPGTVWRLDLPGDGSNITSNNYEAFSHWSSALIEAVSQFKHVIVVAHSTGGMYVLSLPQIENYLDGLVLLDSAPNAEWQILFGKMLEAFPVPGLEALQKRYQECPNNETLKELTIASTPFLFTEKGLALGIKMLESLPYNYEACQWSQEHFDQTYQAKWFPQTIPTMILCGEQDLVTPSSLFAEEEQFHRDNIKIESIKNGGHFPWIENPKDVAAAFKSYCTRGYLC